MKGISKTTLTVGAIILALILLVAVNILASTAIRSVRLDLTEDKLFTVSEGTRQVVSSIQEPIDLNFYFSRSLAEQSPAHGNYAERVRELLEHYVRLSDGKLRLHIYDPEPFSELEDRAVAQGLFGIPLTSAGDRAYFGLAATNSTDDVEVIPLFDQRREAFLEYDLTRSIYNLANPKKSVIGLVENLNMQGDPMRRQGPWAILEQMQQFFRVQPLGADFDKVADDVDVLMIVHPQGMAPKTLYAIDQFVMRGGKILAFVDPHAESVLLTQRGREPGASVSDLGGLLDAWGVKIDTSKFVADPDAAIRVGANSGGREVTVPYLGWLSLSNNVDPGMLASSDVVTGELDEIVMGVAGAITAADGATTTLTPLIQSGPRAALMDADPIRFSPDPTALLRQFKPGDRALILAARVQGPVRTAFPDGLPKAEGADAAAEATPAEPPPAEPAPAADAATAAQLTAAKQPLNAIVVADADLLADRFWLREQDFLGQRIAMPTSSNANFIINALDNLTGSEGLISLRSRGVSQRPFTVIEDIRKKAELSYRQKEEDLQQKLKDTETKLARLQTTGAGADGAVILSDEQKEAINEFRRDMLGFRQQLRDVQHDQRREIDSLNTVLTAVNIWAMPILISIIALVIAVVRRSRHRQRQSAA